MLKSSAMPRRKRGGGARRGKQGRESRAAARRERKAGLYLSPGDPDFKSLSDQLKVQGLTLRDVCGDGNCLFRALAEQLDDHHSNLRHRAVEHIRANGSDYAPFLDEDTSLESHVCELDKDGTFAGNDAIVAVSRLCGVNIIIHQLGTPCWEVKTPAPVRKTLHIAYLRGEHYCSVLPLYPGQDLPQLEAKQHNHTPMHFSSSSSSPSAAAARADHVERKKDDVLCVLEATGCQDQALVEQCLRENGGEVNLAIVELLQMLALVGCESGNNDVQVEDDGAQLSLSPSKLTTTTPKPRRPGKQRHLSNRERKEAAKAVRKHSAQEARRQQKSVDRNSDSSSKTDLNPTTI